MRNCKLESKFANLCIIISVRLYYKYLNLTTSTTKDHLLALITDKDYKLRTRHESTKHFTIVEAVHVLATIATNLVTTDNACCGNHHTIIDAMLVAVDDPAYAVYTTSSSKTCLRCKAVRYCLQECQQSYWTCGHKTICNHFHESAKSIICGIGGDRVGG
ncbi:hypothetical protein VNO78_15376 [Psophocarpus tetragonolobus]|uniref:MYND-type domain-containing protein n=1 Tax=Psophocarpus tetragonolobus TaxID=3891 RepID=A0AAN9SEX7_PSOTE